MASVWKRTAWRMALSLCALGLVMILAACNDSGNTSSANTPSSQPAPLKPFQGTGFTISYPGNWHQQADGDQATFADPVSRNLLAVFSDPNVADRSASDIGNQAMADFMKTLLINSQPVSVASTYTLAGASWVQYGATGILASDPGVQGNFYLLVANYPPQGTLINAYEIEYYGPSSTFDQAKTIFQSMLQSFKFTS
jgi:hypothetical protein